MLKVRVWHLWSRVLSCYEWHTRVVLLFSPLVVLRMLCTVFLFGHASASHARPVLVPVIMNACVELSASYSSIVSAIDVCSAPLTLPAILTSSFSPSVLRGAVFRGQFMTPCLCNLKQRGGQFLTLRTGTSSTTSLCAWSVESRTTVTACHRGKHDAAGSP